MDFCRCCEKAEEGGGKIATVRCQLSLQDWILDVLSQSQKAFGNEAIIPSEREEGTIAGRSSHTGTLLAQKHMTSHLNNFAYMLISSN